MTIAGKILTKRYSVRNWGTGRAELVRGRGFITHFVWFACMPPVGAWMSAAWMLPGMPYTGPLVQLRWS